MILTVAIHLLHRTDIVGSIDDAQRYLCAFIKHFGGLYGKQNVVYNVYNLCHLADDVRKYGALHQFTAFAFESHLGYIKKLLRKPNHSLTQVVHRLIEKQKTSDNAQCEIIVYPQLKKSHNETPVLDEGISADILH